MKEYKGIKLKTVLTIDKKGLAAVTASTFAALKAAFGKYDVVHFHERDLVQCCGCINYSKRNVLRRYMGFEIYNMDNQRKCRYIKGFRGIDHLSKCSFAEW